MNTFRETLSGALTLPDASLLPFAIAALLVPLAVYAIVRWAMRVGVERRARLYCPVHHTRVRVQWRPGREGGPVEVRRCELLTQRGLRACDAPCVKAIVARAA